MKVPSRGGVGRTREGRGDWFQTIVDTEATPETTLVDECWSLIDERWALFRDAVWSWEDGDDEPVACPSRGRPAPVHTWRWADDHFAFGHLAFTFWNWPSLRPEFVGDFSRRLGGHRTVLLEGKL